MFEGGEIKVTGHWFEPGTLQLQCKWQQAQVISGLSLTIFAF